MGYQAWYLELFMVLCQHGYSRHNGTLIEDGMAWQQEQHKRSGYVDPFIVEEVEEEVELSNRRSTVLGTSYAAGSHTVLVREDGSSACTCGKDEQGVVCEHRRAALAQEQAYKQEAAQRSAYCEQFAIYA